MGPYEKFHERKAIFFNVHKDTKLAFKLVI